MNSGRLYSADSPLLSHKQCHQKSGMLLKVVLSITSLCFLLLFCINCGQSPELQTSNTGYQGQANQTSNQITYVAIGASDTFGIGTSDPYMENWPTDLADKLNQKVHLINLGIPGTTLHEALRLELPVAIDSHPKLITIWLGVNDIADKVPVKSYTHDLDMMLTRLWTGTASAQILIANIPDLTLLPYFASYNQQDLHNVIDEYNLAIAQEAQQHHAILVNMSQQNYNLRTHPEYISNDGLHPT
ncbi:MAG: SGNH/GDSL hydrolase family protein, partial [Ktedonobacteraceae bacterium]